jgi:RNA polymerase sigma factor (sigma-70 family)
MPQNSDVPPEGLDHLLAWLNPDRELASSEYVELRHALLRIFAWNRCADPEGMTDEVFDRIAKKFPDLKETFQGNPKAYFYGVANNLIKEYQKKVKSYVPLDTVELISSPRQEVDEETPDMRYDCFSECLQKLSPEKRELILSYYAKEKQAKIIHRAELAQQLGISSEALRVRMRRIRGALEECIERCLEPAGAEGETD